MVKVFLDHPVLHEGNTMFTCHFKQLPTMAMYFHFSCEIFACVQTHVFDVDPNRNSTYKFCSLFYFPNK